MNGRTKDLGKKVAEHFDQDFEGTVEGPHQIGPYAVARVWTHDSEKDEYHAHYAVEDGGKLRYFDNFSPFAVWLGKELAGDPSADRSEREVRLGMAAAVVFVALGLLVYLIVWDRDQSSVVNYLLGAVVGGACGYVFLKKPPKPPANT